MGNTNDALAEVTKIGNYAIPAFGAFLTASLAVGSFPKTASEGQAIIVNFALYTVAAACVGYMHRIFYLRCRRAQQERDEKPTNLPTWTVAIFLVFHLVLAGILFYRLWPLGTLEKHSCNKQKVVLGANKAMKSDGVKAGSNSK